MRIHRDVGRVRPTGSESRVANAHPYPVSPAKLFDPRALHPRQMLVNSCRSTGGIPTNFVELGRGRGAMVLL